VFANKHALALAHASRGGKCKRWVPYPRNGAGAEWRGRSAAEVCTSEARKIRVPLARARDGVPQEGLVTVLCAERRRSFGVRVAGGKGRLRMVTEYGSFLAGCRLGGAFLPLW
jgi:hypothetical protein